MKKIMGLAVMAVLMAMVFSSCAFNQKPAVRQTPPPVELRVVEDSELQEELQEYSDEVYESLDVEQMLNVRQAECAQMYSKSLPDSYACYAELEEVFPDSFGEYNHEFNLVNMAAIMLERSKILSGKARQEAVEQAHEDLLPVFEEGEFEKKDVRIRATALLAMAQYKHYMFSAQEGEEDFQKGLKVIREDVVREYDQTLATQWLGIARTKFADFKRICGQKEELR